MEFITNHITGIIVSGVSALALWGLKRYLMMQYTQKLNQ